MPRFPSHRSALKKFELLSPKFVCIRPHFSMLFSITASVLSRALRNLAKEYVFEAITHLRLHFVNRVQNQRC